ncbi:hypothetical protein HY251_11020 [bacterium]|nr:hypothetical protein [bacterium]
MISKNLLGGVFLTLVLAAPARAEDAAHGSTVTPDERGHLLKRTKETVKLATTKDDAAKVDHLLAAADERIKELAKMDAKGKTSHHDALAQSHSKTTKGAAGVIENGAAKGKDMTGCVARYAAATAKHLAVLERVLAHCPPQARKGLQNAIEHSEHGHEEAMAAHERGRGRGHGNGKGKPGAGGQGEAGAGPPKGGPHGPPAGHGEAHGPPPGKGHGPSTGDDGKGKGDGPKGGPHGPPPGKGGGPHGPGGGKGNNDDDSKEEPNGGGSSGSPGHGRGK